jgi:hypothetical protein
MLQRANTEGAKGALSRITLTSDRKATRPNAAGGRDRADPAPPPCRSTSDDATEQP